MDTVAIYISGQCDPNPGPGAWAAALYFHDTEKIKSGSLDDVTNHEAELHAAIEALRALKRPCSVDLYSCSQAFAFIADGRWHTVQHAELWTQLREVESPHDVRYHWISKSESRHLSDIRHYAMRLLTAEPEP